MKIKLLVASSMLAYSLSGYAANSPVNAFLLAAQTDVNALDLSGSSATDVNAISSWIEEAQFRFHAREGNDFDSNERSQSYEIRVQPKAWGQRQAEENILKLKLNQHHHRYNHAFNLALKKRYFIWLVYLEQQSTTQYLFKLADLSTQEIHFIRRQVMTDKFNAEKLLDAEGILMQSQGLAALNLTRLNALQNQLGVPLDSAESIRKHAAGKAIISIVAMSNKLLSWSDIPQSAPAVLSDRLKLEMTQAKNKLMNVEQQLGVNLLSFAYRDSQNDNMAFQVGINIPLGTNFSKAESHYELYDAQAKLDQSVATMVQSLADIQRKISWLAEESELVDAQIQRLQRHLQKDTVKTNPFLIINLRKALIEHIKNHATIKLKALKLYIKYLSLSGQLTQPPLRNWIEKGTPELAFNSGYE